MTGPAQRALAHVRRLGTAGTVPPGTRITVNFHPDRVLGDGRTVAEHLLTDGVYRSQFETGISNGGLTAHPGGDRERWERRMFDGAYPPGQRTGRPVYGGLDLTGRPAGACPRFGSCHLVLRAEVTARATFSHGDSVTAPTAVGTADAFGLIHAALAAGSGDGILDDYVEAQIHGEVRTADVEAVVADPAFTGTPTATHLGALAPLRYHHGYVLPATDFPDDLRGPQAAALARSLGPALIDAAVLGEAARAGADPQLVKYLWHILVLRGRPRS